MSRRDDRVSLADMLSYAREGVELLGGRSLEELEGDRVLYLALTRVVEIVGEAANRVSKEMQGSLSGVPWAKVIGMRNWLIHGYDHVNLNTLRRTVVEDFPVLIGVLEGVVGE